MNLKRHWTRKRRRVAVVELYLFLRPWPKLEHPLGFEARMRRMAKLAMRRNPWLYSPHGLLDLVSRAKRLPDDVRATLTEQFTELREMSERGGSA